MPKSRGNSPDGASPDRLADWQRRRFEALRDRAADASGFDDALPVDMLADPAAAAAAIARLRSAE
jgi:hypothetical protein